MNGPKARISSPICAMATPTSRPRPGLSERLSHQHLSASRPPWLPLPVTPRDRFGDLYLDALAAQTRLQRRLSRLEATLDRQVEFARAELALELSELRDEATILLEDNDRLRARIARDPVSQQRPSNISANRGPAASQEKRCSFARVSLSLLRSANRCTIEVAKPSVEPATVIGSDGSPNRYPCMPMGVVTTAHPFQR